MKELISNGGKMPAFNSNQPKERPILFSGPMILAILDGRKTQTRRMIKSQPKPHMTDPVCIDRVFPQKPWLFTGPNLDENGKPLAYDSAEQTEKHGGWPDCSEQFSCPYGQPGDRLWVRETFAPHDDAAMRAKQTEWLYYRADDEMKYESDLGWKPSIFMPRWASRITLEITDVRVQRLQDISAEDAIAEGCQIPVSSDNHPLLCISGDPLPSDFSNKKWNDWGFEDYARFEFARLWQSINGKTHSWDSNPWMWAITFRRVDQTSV